MKTEKFQRKPFIVECVQVTAENMEEVARWTNGKITQTDPQIAEQLKKPVLTWVQVEVQSPMNEKQSQAHIGDWVLYANRGFKIYTNKAFERTFEPVFKGERPAPKIHVDKKEAAVSWLAPKPEILRHQDVPPRPAPPKGAEVRTVHRSAVDGEFVTKKEADANPDTTVEETIVIEGSGQAIVVADETADLSEMITEGAEVTPVPSTPLPADADRS